MSGFPRVRSGDVLEPLTVVVAGNSASLFVVPRNSRGERTYGEQLPLELPGIRIDVRHTGRWYDRIDQLRGRYEESVRNHFPDVLVLHYGMAECQPGVLPWRVSRHFLNWDRGASLPSRTYRSRIAPRVWRTLRDGQQAAAARLPERPHRLAPQRFSGELTKIATMVRDEVKPLVLVVDVDPPGPRVEHWLPGTAARARRWNDLLQQTVDELRAVHGDEIRLVRASEDVDPDNVEKLLPDGLHRNAEGHRLLSRRIAAEVLDWLREDSQ